MILLKDADADAIGHVIIKSDGVWFVESETMTLEEMQEAVGGPIEAIPGTNYEFWCNEEGQRLGLKPNDLVPGIIGNVLMCGAGREDSFPLSAREYRTRLKLRGMTI